MRSREKSMVQDRYRASRAEHQTNRRKQLSQSSSDATERLSSEELVQVLLRGGARVLARQEHGVFLEARRRLIFLRRASVIDAAELEDALRAAAIGPGRFDALLADVRREEAIAAHALR
jgi:hypothetical protein